MREKTKMRDVMKSAFKETPDSFRNAVNNAIAEAALTGYNKCQLPEVRSVVITNLLKKNSH